MIFLNSVSSVPCSGLSEPIYFNTKSILMMLISKMEPHHSISVKQFATLCVMAQVVFKKSDWEK